MAAICRAQLTSETPRRRRRDARVKAGEAPSHPAGAALTSVLRGSACPDWRSGALALWRSGALALCPRRRPDFGGPYALRLVPLGFPLAPDHFLRCSRCLRLTDEPLDPAPPGQRRAHAGCWARGAAAPSAPLSLSANRSATPSERGCLCVERESTLYFQTARSSQLDVDLRIARRRVSAQRWSRNERASAAARSFRSNGGFARSVR